MGPEVIAAASLATTIVGGGIGAAGASQSASYRSKVASNNTLIAEGKAKYAEQAGRVQAENARMRTTALVNKEKAIQGASGIDVNSGTPAAVRESTQALGDLDSQTILHNALKTAMGFRNEGTNFQSESKLTAQEGEYGVASSLLGTASKVGDKWMTFREKGIGGRGEY